MVSTESPTLISRMEFSEKSDATHTVLEIRNNHEGGVGVAAIFAGASSNLQHFTCNWRSHRDLLTEHSISQSEQLELSRCLLTGGVCLIYCGLGLSKALSAFSTSFFATASCS